MKNPPVLSDRLGQTVIALTACLCITVAANYFRHPVMLILIGLAPLALISILRLPLLMMLSFSVFSFFRIHEVFPVLYPLHIPQLLAIGALVSLGWGIWGRSVKIYWTRELTIFTLFFIAVSLGILFATNRAAAWSSWSGTYVKIAVMTLALAWLTTAPVAFKTVARVMVIAGIVVGCVALYNKMYGIGLVEGSRVTIGRDIGSMLGDPNDLALVLLFPASFAISMLLSKSDGWLIRLFAFVGTAAVLAAIVATQSRGGLLGITAVAGIFAWRRMRNKWLLIVGAVVVLSVLFVLAGVSERASGGAHEAGVDESAMGRIYAWGAAWSMALSNPLTGVGLNNFLSNYWAYSAHWDGQNHAVHSTWFGVLAETGFLGFVLFSILVFFTIKSATATTSILKRAGPEHEQALILAQAVEAGLFGFLVSGTFLTMGFTWPFYLLLSLTVAVSRYVKEISHFENQ